MKFLASRRIMLTASLAAVLATQIGGQSTLVSASALATRSLSPSQELFNKIASLDSALFASVMGAYDECDLEKFASFFSEDIEFYHDKGGLTYSRKALVDSVKSVCGRQRRELVPGTLEVYPVPGYGAIEVGAHRFYHRQGTEEVGGTVTAKFLHVWQNKDGEWKITRVISYAH